MVTQVTLLGRAAIHTPTGPLEPAPSKTTALLYYLAYRGDWVRRDDFIYLFYPDLAEHQARQNLRPLLTRLRRFAYAEGLEVEPTRLRWQVSTDVAAFRDALRSGHLVEAVQQYKGSLLGSFHLSGVPEFESWLDLERGEVQRNWCEATLTLAAEFESQGRYQHAAELLKQVYQADPLDETSFRHYFTALARADQKSDALQAFASFESLLNDEVASEPERETYTLVERVRSGEALPAPTGAAPTKTTTKTSLAKPTLHTTAFIGREAEIRRVVAHLLEPSCRLLSILGPGGMGKTRLASEVAARLESDFADGVCFVPFASVASPKLMVSALAAALHFSFFGERDPKHQLLEHLANKNMLLVLDNLEHLLGGVHLLTELVQAAPNLKLLATSRERLGLHAEWVYDLAGMSVPEMDEADVERADAVTLFEQTAKKARADFTLESDAATVAHICRALGGMPLAIELAASWLRVLSVTEVAEELGKGFDLLESSLRDLPERHHDLRTVFGASWRRLSAVEQTALQKLAVFQGSFSREAALEVADTGLPLLLALVNKSFVQHDGSGCFSQHPLVQQYLLVEASADAETLELTREKHAAYFAYFMHQREALRRGGQARAVRAEITLELPNLRAAWFWAAAEKREDLLAPMLTGLSDLYYRTERYLETKDLLAYAATRLQSRSVVHGRVLYALGNLNNWQLEYEQGAELLEQSLVIFQEHRSKRDEAKALNSLINNYDVSSHPSWEIKKLCETAVALFRELGDKDNEAWNLGRRASYDPDHRQREHAYREAIRLLREVDGAFGLAWMLCGLAEIRVWSHGAYREAESLMNEAIKLERELDMASRLAWWLNQHGVNDLYQGKLEVAERNFKESLSIGKALEPGYFIWEWERALCGLGRLAHLRGDLASARALFTEALELNDRHTDPFGVKPGILLGFSKLALAENSLAEAEDLCRRTDTDRFDSHEFIDYAWAKAAYLTQLGAIAARREEVDAASRYFYQALDLSQTWHFLPAALQLCVSFADLAQKQGDEERAAHLFGLAASHPASMFETIQAARRGLEGLPANGAGAGLERPLELTLEQVVETLRS